MPYEDFTTYTEVDPNNHITITSATQIDADLYMNEDAHVYDDKGANHFSGDFEHLLDIRCTYETVSEVLPVYWMLSNVVDDRRDLRDVLLEDWLCVFHYNGSLYLEEGNGGSTTSDTYAGWSVGTWYYLVIERDESIGTYGQLQCRIYSDAARTNLLDTLAISLTEKQDFRYVFAANTHNVPIDRHCTVDIENLDLQEAIVGQPYISRVQRIPGMKTWGGIR